MIDVAEKQSEYIEKAKLKLREDDLRKAQSLKLFREWLAKHPFLSDVRQDDRHVLQFLRLSKYSMDDAFHLFERHYLSRKCFPQYSDFSPENVKKAMTLFDLGFCYPLSQRDEMGRSVILIQTRKIDLSKHTMDDAGRLLLYVVAVLQEEEETQIAGVIVIFDHTGLTMKQVMTPVDAKNMTDHLTHFRCVSGKCCYIVNMPHIITKIFRFGLTLMKEMTRKRITVIKDLEELKTVVSESIMPKELGGVRAEADMMKDFLKLRDSHENSLKSFIGSKVDWENVTPEKILSFSVRGNQGSFRKISID